MPYLNLQQEDSVADKMQDVSDEELLRLSISKNPELFSHIITRYRSAFLRKAEYILKDRADAEDVVQETFVKIYIKGSRFKTVEGASFQSWAYKVLINTCITMYRKKSRKKEISAEELAEFLPDTAYAVEIESRLSYNAFLSVVSRLPESFSRVLRNLVLSGKSPKQIAMEEGVSENAIRTRFHRARKAFEKVRADIS